MAAPLSLLPRRPPVSSRQAVTMATRLFNLSIRDPTSVKELVSNEDRNFSMRGSWMREAMEMGETVCKEYVLKISNNKDSNHKRVIQVQCDAMLFLQARGYICSTPVPSVLNTYFVKCKIPKDTQPGSVALETDTATLEIDNMSTDTNIIHNSVCDSLGNLDNAGDLGNGIEIYDGKEYSEKEYFVCAVRLLNFVPGKMLTQIPLNTELLFNAGMAVGRLDRDLKDFDCPRLDRSGFLWDLSDVADTLEKFLDAINNEHHIKMIREVFELYRKEVVPKLHLLPKQFIHGDANCANILVTSDDSFGFIDFGDLNYTCRVFELAISLMYILNVDGALSCGRTRMAGYFFAGYKSINPLSDEELQLLHVLVASRFCQTLVLGAYTSKNLDPDNAYVMETSRNGWKNFEAFWKVPKEETLKTWLEISDNKR
ncbi:hypothetical protein ACROYT_G000458 [Oculina patagonica]